MRALRWLGIAIVALGLVLVAIGVGFAVAARFSDGPLGPFPGGPLRAGPLVSESRVDWSAATDGKIERQLQPIWIELELVESARSRVTGVFLYEGDLYVPCDLGFMWGRFSGPNRWILHFIYLVKHWHEDAERDGRAVVRLEGKRYERQAVRVADAEQLATLRSEFEKLVEPWVAPDPVGEPPTEGPRDIWFFRMDPRPAT